jgi:hypothetical protein
MTNAIVRSMKKTKMEQLKTMENMNRDAINGLMQNYNQFTELSQAILNSLVNLQMEVMAMKAVLKQRGVVDDLVLSQEKTKIQEVLKMEKEATIIQP